MQPHSIPPGACVPEAAVLHRCKRHGLRRNAVRRTRRRADDTDKATSANHRPRATARNVPFGPHAPVVRNAAEPHRGVSGMRRFPRPANAAPRIHRKADRPDCARTVPPHARKKRKSRYPTLRVSARSPIPVRQRVSFCAPTSRSGRSLRPTRNIRRGSRPADGPVRDRNGRRGRCSVRRPAR